MHWWPGFLPEGPSRSLLRSSQSVATKSPSAYMENCICALTCQNTVRNHDSASRDGILKVPIRGTIATAADPAMWAI